MQKILTLVLVILGLLAISVVGMATYIGSYVETNDARYNSLVGKLATKPVATPTPTQAVQNPQPVIGEDRTVEMTITDDSVSPNGIPAYKGKQLTIEITNNAKDSRSLVIDKFNIDSGAIKAGGTKEIIIKTIANDAGTYEFKLLSSDGATAAKGNIIIL